MQMSTFGVLLFLLNYFHSFPLPNAFTIQLDERFLVDITMDPSITVTVKSVDIP